jgi:hypothetical protein
VDALTSDIESFCNFGGTARFVEIPAHPERSGRKNLNPVNVAELRPKISIRFDDRVVSRPNTTLIVGLSGFGHQALGLQLVQYLIEVRL